MADNPNDSKSQEKLNPHPEKPGEAQRTGGSEPTVEQWTGATSAPQAVPPAGQSPASASPNLPPSAQKPGATPLKPEEKETPKPAAAGHAPAAKPAGPAPQPWQSELAERLRRRFGSGIREASTYLGQNYIVADPAVAYQVLAALHDEEEFDYLVDVTAVHYPEREAPFEVVWIVYSFAHNERVRIKASYRDQEPAPSVVSLWATANWLEREVFDMFGIPFDGHPDLRRILLPEDWQGHPLRKDYGIIQQDQQWVKINLGIESGQ
jgi:NADH-quinone oxidoreductase subunit C